MCTKNGEVGSKQEKAGNRDEWLKKIEALQGAEPAFQVITEAWNAGAISNAEAAAFVAEYLPMELLPAIGGYLVENYGSDS